MCYMDCVWAHDMGASQSLILVVLSMEQGLRRSAPHGGEPELDPELALQVQVRHQHRHLDLEAPGPHADLNQQQHAGPTRVAHVNDAVQIRVLHYDNMMSAIH